MRAVSCARWSDSAVRSPSSSPSTPAACWTNSPTTMALRSRETSAAPARSTRSGRCVATHRSIWSWNECEEVAAHGQGGRLAADRLADHQADEVLDVEHRHQDVGQERRQAGLVRPLAVELGPGGMDREEALFHQDRLEQVLLGGEVVVQRGHVEPGCARQVPHARAVDAPLGHQGEGDVEDPPPRGRPLTVARTDLLGTGALGVVVDRHLQSHFSASRSGNSN